MPLYEYECEACGHRFEVIQKFSDAPLDACPKCGGVVRKLQSAPAFQFKGTGWYVTDYAKSGSADARDGRKTEAKDAKSGEKSDSGSTPAASSGTSPAAPKTGD